VVVYPTIVVLDQQGRIRARYEKEQFGEELYRKLVQKISELLQQGS